MPLRALALAVLFAGCHLLEPAVVPGEFCDDGAGHPVPRYVGYECCATGGQCEEELYCYGVDECRGPLPPNDAVQITGRKFR